MLCSPGGRAGRQLNFKLFLATGTCDTNDIPHMKLQIRRRENENLPSKSMSLVTHLFHNSITMTTILSLLLVYTVLLLLPLAQAQNQACPIEPPDAEGSSCIADGFVQGQVCRYDYIDVTCPPESMLCVPITYYNCDDYRLQQQRLL